MPELAHWDSFYVIVASAAGALIGLQFVVMTLIAEKPPKSFEAASAAFATPTIVHFSASLLISALMRAPWPALIYPALLWALIGLGGLGYIVTVGRQMKRQTAYAPGLEDWLFHVALPVVSYALLVGAALAVRTIAGGALFAVAAGALLLLFIGIHNAWDAVAYHVFVNIHKSHAANDERRENE